MNAKLKILALTLIVVFAMPSCGSDDTPGIDQNLFSSWTLSSTVLRDCANAGDNSTVNEVCDDQTCTKLIMSSDRRYERRVTQRGQEEITERGQVEIGEAQIRFLPDNTTGSTILDYQVTANQLVLRNVTLICIEEWRYSK